MDAALAPPESRDMSKPLNNEAVEAAAAAWIARRDAQDRWTPEQEQALRAWIAESTAHRVAWVRMNATWRRAQAAGARIAERRTGAAQVEVAGPRRPSLMRRRTVAGWALAAGLALGVGVAWMVQVYSTRSQQLVTQVGVRESVTLADGSQVTLNTHTRGRASMKGPERRFWLEEGEAYFEVTHDPLRPFVVYAGRDRVTVLGTRFSVRHESGRTEVNVVEGRVRLDRGGAGPEAAVLVTRNESAVSAAGNILVIERTAQQVKDELGWREGRVVFNGTTLAEVAAEFNRYNERQLVIEGDAAALRFGGNFDVHNLDGFARLAQESFGLDVRSEGNSVVISRR
jgi:transmembrane sensor